MIRSSTADEFGNLTMSEEAIYGSVLAITQAVKAQPNPPGVVIARYSMLVGLSIPGMSMCQAR